MNYWESVNNVTKEQRVSMYMHLCGHYLVYFVYWTAVLSSYMYMYVYTVHYLLYTHVEVHVHVHVHVLRDFTQCMIRFIKITSLNRLLHVRQCMVKVVEF